MSTELEPSSTPATDSHQRRQANKLLMRLQWLLILLLIIALAWLYIGQLRFEKKIGDRLQTNEQLVTRLNEMDDKLFAISQQSFLAPSTPITSQAQNQLDLVRIQLQAADSLLADDNYKATIDLLKGLQWQLSQSNNEIAPALNVVIQQSLNKDIERLQAQSNQPSSWQLQNLAIQNIQTFLHSHERSPESKSQAGKLNKVGGSAAILTHRQLTIHEVIMTLNLASQASNMRESDQLKSYLSQAREQLQTLVSSTKSATPTSNAASQKNRATKLDDMQTPNNISEVISGLDKLIANAPMPSPLLTSQVLEQSKSSNP